MGSMSPTDPVLFRSSPATFAPVSVGEITLLTLPSDLARQQLRALWTTWRRGSLVLTQVPQEFPFVGTPETLETVLRTGASSIGDRIQAGGRVVWALTGLEHAGPEAPHFGTALVQLINTVCRPQWGSHPVLLLLDSSYSLDITGPLFTAQFAPHVTAVAVATALNDACWEKCMHLATQAVVDPELLSVAHQQQLVRGMAQPLPRYLLSRSRQRGPAWTDRFWHPATLPARSSDMDAED